MNYYPVKELSCGEAGFDCNYIAKWETEEVTKKGSRADHDGPWDLT
jgi:predicted small metal-binding protein